MGCEKPSTNTWVVVAVDRSPALLPAPKAHRAVFSRSRSPPTSNNPVLAVIAVKWSDRGPVPRKGKSDFRLAAASMQLSGYDRERSSDSFFSARSAKRKSSGKGLTVDLDTCESFHVSADHERKVGSLIAKSCRPAEYTPLPKRRRPKGKGPTGPSRGS